MRSTRCCTRRPPGAACPWLLSTTATAPTRSRLSPWPLATTRSPCASTTPSAPACRRGPAGRGARRERGSGEGQSSSVGRGGGRRHAALKGCAVAAADSLPLCPPLQDPFQEWERELDKKKDEAHTFEGEKRVFEAPVVSIPEGGPFAVVSSEDAEGAAAAPPGSAELAAMAAAAGGGGEAGARANAAGDAGEAAAEPAAAAAAASSKPAPPPLPPAPGPPALWDPLPGPVLRAAHYVYRAGPLGGMMNDSSRGIQVARSGMLQPPWRLAAGPNVHRWIMYGERSEELCSCACGRPLRLTA